MKSRADQSHESWRERAARHVHRMPLVPVAILLMTGIGASSWLDQQNLWLSFLPAMIMAVCGVISLALGRRRWAMLCGWCLLLAMGASLSVLQRAPETDDLGRIASRDSRPLVFRAEIMHAPIWRPNAFARPGSDANERWQTQWTVLCTAVRDGDQWRDVRSQSTLSVSGRSTHLLPGDQITVFGSCSAIAPPSNPGENDLRVYYRSEHQFVSLRAESIDQVVLDRTSWRRPLARLIAIAVCRIDRAIHRYVPLGQGPLAAALIFGQRQQVDLQEQQKLLSTGTLHMLAISGMHIELVAGALWLLCWSLGLSLRKSLVIVASIVVIYALIAGANPPVLRAVFTVLAVCVARWQNRRSDLANLLAFSGLLLLAMRSSWMANVGVQLSYLAVATIAIFARGPTGRGARADALAAVIEESWTWKERALRRAGRWVWQMTCLSFWVWLITAPLIWCNFHVVSPVAIPLNVLLWPSLVVGLLSGLVLSVTWWIAPLAWLLGWICGLSLWSISGIVWLGDASPLGHIWMPAPATAWIVTFYGLLLAGLVTMRFAPAARAWLGTALVAWMLIGAVPWLAGTHGHGPEWLRRTTGAIVQRLPAHDWFSAWIVPASTTRRVSVDNPIGRYPSLQLTFLDVGHGTAVLIEMPDGQVWMYDAGHLGSEDRSYREIAQALWCVPTARVDRLFLSHADADHYNAVPGLVERFSIDEVVGSPQFWQHPAPELGLLRAKLLQQQIAAERMVKGEVIHHGDVALHALHPPGDWSDKVDNGNSLTLAIHYGGRCCLLPGDLEKAGLERLLVQSPIDCDVLMAPHHGSTTQDPTALFRWCQPEWVIISGGARAARPQVIERYSLSGICPLITHRLGAIRVRISQDGQIEMHHWLVDHWESINR